MDLGIKGRKAIVCAASKGLGKACANSLAHEGVDLTICSRSQESIDAAAKEIRDATGVMVRTVACDISTEVGRQAVLAACPEPDILVNNAGGPPHGDFRDWDRDTWIKALDSNMLSAIFMIKATVDTMIERRFGRIVNITSRSVKAPILPLGLSNGARAGLTGFCAGLGHQIIQHNVTINAVLPGSILTDRVRDTVTATAAKSDRSFEELMAERETGIPAGRFGRAEELGDACAYLCSTQAGYITGQNILLDGGSYGGTL